MLTRRKTFVEVGVQRVQHGLHPGPVDQRARLQGVEAVLPEGFNHVPDIDVMQESCPLDVSQLSSSSVRRKANVIVFLESVIQGVQLRVAVLVVISVVITGAVIHLDPS